MICTCFLSSKLLPLYQKKYRGQNIYPIIWVIWAVKQNWMYNQYIMQINKYIGIPKTDSTGSSQTYLTYIEFLISLITGILLICFTLINQYVVTQSQLEIVYLFAVILIFKVVIPINYMCKRKPPITHLEQQSKIRVGGLFIPSFLKSLFYFGLMMLILYLGWLIIVLPVLISIVGVELLQCYVKHKKKTILKSSVSGSQQRKKEKVNVFKCINFRQILVEVLIIISLFLHVEVFDMDYNIHTILLICFSGSLCLMGFFYLHHQIFELYSSDVDEVMAKQYPIQLFNCVLYCLIFLFSSYLEIDEIEELFSYETPQSSPINATIRMNTTTNTQQYEISPKFLYITQFPIHTVVAVTFSVVYQYLCFEMIKNSSFKKLFLTQLTGIFWFNIFYFKEGMSTQLYFSTFISLMALAILTKIISIQKINNIFKRCSQWMRIVRPSDRKKMVQELEEK